MRAFFRAIRTISAPICVSLGAASTVPSGGDGAPSYVQDAFKHLYHQKPNTKTTPIADDTVEQTNVFVEQPQAAPASFNQYLSRFIDHTVLKPLSTENDIRKMCSEAIKHNFFSVCCNPCWVSLCRELLRGTNVKICCVVGFPLGSNTTEIKVLEARQAVADGANEIDMVMNIGHAKSGNWGVVFEDIATVVTVVPNSVKVKVILETCLLTDQEIVEACKRCVRAGAHFVKTSTGFGGGGATVHHVKLMRKTVDEESVRLGMEIGSVLVKASGGIRDSQTAKEMLSAGADRIGASSGVKIINQNITSTGAQSTGQDQY